MPSRPCLIFGHYPLRPGDGGPSGFLAQNVVGMDSPDFDFFGMLPSLRPSAATLLRQSLFREPARSIRRMGFTALTPLAREMSEIRSAFLAQRGPEYEWVWFHDVLRLAACVDLVRPAQRVILQSHSPELPSREFSNAGANDADVTWVRHAEITAFRRADVYVAPNAGALAPARELLGVEQRVEFVLSGSRRLEARADLPLSRELVYYLYIGRRLPAKGYDVLLDAFDVAYAADNSLRLVLVGDGTIERHPGVIDVGRSEDPSIWLACCDYLVSPNRHSYFDLAIMEAMSIGTPVLMTATEGHEYFASIQHDGLVTTSASDPAELAAALLGNRRKRKQNATGTRANMEIYEATFSVTKYQSRLTDFFHRLL